jgi:hypothetical protein
VIRPRRRREIVGMTEPLRYRLLDRALERGLLRDPVLRAGSRAGVILRLRREEHGGVEDQERRLRELIARMSAGPITEQTGAANAQHYELPVEFFGLFLGPRRKYSGCLWCDGVPGLAAAEVAMLALICERAGIEDGMEILDLGCGWGSLRCGSPSDIRTPASWASPTRTASASGSRPSATAAGSPAWRSSPPTSTTSRRSGASTASCRSRCSSTCATGPGCCAASPAGWSPAGARSCMSSRTATSPTASTGPGRPRASSLAA